MLHDCLFICLFVENETMTDMHLRKNCQRTAARKDWLLPRQNRRRVPIGWRSAMQAWGYRSNAARCQITQFVEEDENEEDSDEEGKF